MEKSTPKYRFFHLFHRVFNRWKTQSRVYKGYKPLYKGGPGRERLPPRPLRPRTLGFAAAALRAALPLPAMLPTAVPLPPPRPLRLPLPLIRGGAGPYSANGVSAEKTPGDCARPQPRPAAPQPEPCSPSAAPRPPAPGHNPALHQPRPGPPAAGGSCKNLPQTGVSDGNLSHKVVYWTR